MYLRRLLCTLTVALVGAAVASTTPAVSAFKGCGRAGYAYAGLLGERGPSGVTATLTTLAEPLVQRGHVAAWVGVGAPGEGPNGTNEWLQVGLNRIAGRPAKLYYEVAGSSGISYVELDSNVLPGRRYRVAVLEMARRPDVWRIWVDGRPANGPSTSPRATEGSRRWRSPRTGTAALRPATVSSTASGASRSPGAREARGHASGRWTPR